MKRSLLGVRLDKCESNIELCLESIDRGELLARDVEGGDARTLPGEPRGEAAASAPRLMASRPWAGGGVAVRGRGSSTGPT